MKGAELQPTDGKPRCGWCPGHDIYVRYHDEDLAGWGLSDRAGEPFRWVLPSLELPPGERTLVWASGKDRPGGSAPFQPQSPDTVAGLVVWLKADGSGMSDGQRVASWNDASGRGNHAVQGTFNRRPTYVANGVNGLPAIRFVRSQNQFLQLPTASFNGMEDLANFTLLAVARWNGAATSGIFGTFGGTLQLAGNGRLGLPDESGFGIFGALRYQPGVQDSPAVLTTPLALAAAAGIHVDGSRNRLELAGSLAGDHPLTKSGGGLLRVTGDHGGWLAPVTVANGTLELAGHLGGGVTVDEGATVTGHGRCGPLDGAGVVLLEGTMLRVPALDGPVCQVVFAAAGPPDFSHPSACGNGVLACDGPVVPGALVVYLDHPAPAPGSRWQGGILMPAGADWRPVLNTAGPVVFVPDEVGTHQFAGRAWSPVAAGRVTRAAITADLGDGPQAAEILEVRLGGGPSRFAEWQAEAFPDPADLANPLVSGPAAAPFGDGLANLVRYALGGEGGSSVAALLPRVVNSPGGRMLRLPFDPGRFDVRVRVEGTENPADWSNADILWDSVAVLPPTDDGWLEVPLPEHHGGRYFVRLSVELP